MSDFSEILQKEVCERFKAKFVPSPICLKLGISENVKNDISPINGLGHSPTKDTTGWYIWAGEKISERVDFFVPLHVRHLSDWCPSVLPYLGLPGGWRFLIADNYEDVWFDANILNE